MADRVGQRNEAGTSLSGRVMLVLLLALASMTVLSMACGQGEDPEPSPEPTAMPTAVPEPTAAPAPSPEPTATPEPSPEPEPVDQDDELTRAYVMDGIGRYERDGLEATVEHYVNRDSIEGERFLIIIDADDGTFVAMPFYQQFLGRAHGYADRFLEVATAEGGWLEHRGFHLAGGDTDNVREEPLRSYLVLRDGLIFISSHSILLENVAEATKDYVARAIALYQTEGLDATVDFYNSQDSLEGHLYLFLIGADDNYLAHPIFPHLIGTDIKDVVGSDGQELGKEIAQTTEEGIWVEYLWPNPVTGIEGPKTTWAIRHDGMIFASGYYAAGETAEAPAWRDADPREYTVEYVNRAVERYRQGGLDSVLNYYNSVASFEGQWYLFATDANDIYIVHPLIPRLIGTDIKDVVGSDGFELGRELAKATEEGVWVEYLWPHPVTLKDVPKVGYAVRHDGMIFASGYYPDVADPETYTKQYVQDAIDYYDSEGVQATIDYYNSAESVDGSYSLLMVDDAGVLVVSPVVPTLIGMDAGMLRGVVAREPIGEWLLAATEQGDWHTYLYPSSTTAGLLTVHIWIIRHDGHVFAGAYFVEQ